MKTGYYLYKDNVAYSAFLTVDNNGALFSRVFDSGTSISFYLNNNQMITFQRFWEYYGKHHPKTIIKYNIKKMSL